jgi:hypothetical protein
MEVTFSMDVTDGESIRALCEVCKIDQKHLVVRSARRRNDHDDFSSITEYQVIQCQNCDCLSFRREYSNSEDYIQDMETGEYLTAYTIDLYPIRTAGRFRIDGYRFLPAEVKAIYDELLQAMNGGQNILAGLGVRLLIEMICRDKKAVGKTLFIKLDDLKSKHVLTESDVEILHRLRSMGNDAAHEGRASSAPQLTLAMNVVENLMKSVYIHPRQAKQAFS